MLIRVAFALALAASSLAAVPTDPNGSAFTEYTISATGISATLIPFGATLTRLSVLDAGGVMKNVVVGYDQPGRYLEDVQTNHTYFGAVVGRYANRIKNGTFAIDGQTHKIPRNEFDGLNALHGGPDGYDQQEWTVVTHNRTTVTFSFLDQGLNNFPGSVLTYATYNVAPGGVFTSVMTSFALDAATPIMLANHVYWNIGSDPSVAILDDTLHLPNARRTVEIDGILIPTGGLKSVGHVVDEDMMEPLNFTAPKTIKEGALYAQECGTSCVGIDNAFILDQPVNSRGDVDLDNAQLVWSSPKTGIRMTMYTNQPSVQLFACVHQDESIVSNLGPVAAFGCLAIEPQQYIDGINNPHWDQTHKQIFSPSTPPAVNYARYVFDVVPSAKTGEALLKSALALGKGLLWE